MLIRPLRSRKVRNTINNAAVRRKWINRVAKRAQGENSQCRNWGKSCGGVRGKILKNDVENVRFYWYRKSVYLDLHLHVYKNETCGKKIIRLSLFQNKPYKYKGDEKEKSHCVKFSAIRGAAREAVLLRKFINSRLLSINIVINKYIFIALGQFGNSIKHRRYRNSQ